MSERAALAERIGKEAVARYSYIHPSAITMGADTGVDGETWGDIVRDIGNLALAAIETAGGWPPIEPITEEEIQVLHRLSWRLSGMTLSDLLELLASLPERHRRLVIGGAP